MLRCDEGRVRYSIVPIQKRACFYTESPWRFAFYFISMSRRTFRVVCDVAKMWSAVFPFTRENFVFRFAKILFLLNKFSSSYILLLRLNGVLWVQSGQHYAPIHSSFIVIRNTLCGTGSCQKQHVSPTIIRGFFGVNKWNNKKI